MSGEKAEDLGYLLHKHPDKVQRFESSVGVSHVFYPESSPTRCTAALLLDVDPVGLVKDKKFRGHGMDTQYATDRPYAASSLLAVALGRVFRSALAGTCETHPHLVSVPRDLTVSITSVPSPRPTSVHELFEPLGWTVHTEHTPLGPGWGDAPYATVILTGTHTVQAALQHVYVLLPVLDGGKHYWVNEDEIDKLERAAGAWLGEHPQRDAILRNSLARQGSLVRQAQAHFGPTDSTPEDPRRTTLRRERLDAVVQALADVGASSVVDIGCGEGQLMAELMERRQFQRILGVDVAAGELARAEKRLHLHDLPDTARERLRLRQSSLLYRDDALTGYDAAVLMEVIEHLDEERLPDAVRHVFGHAQPRCVIVTTPNVEYNVLYDGLPAGQMRHRDHRFEWSRAQFQEWATVVSRDYGYSVSFRPIGENHPDHGPATQMAVFTR